MSIDLSHLPIAGIDVEVLDFGGVLTPPLGGPAQKVVRPGSRTAITFETATTVWEPFGRQWTAQLRRAQRDGAVIEIPQVDFDVGVPGAPVVASAIAGGRLVPLAGLAAGYRLREGQWVSLVVAGRHYADQIEADVVAGGDGRATIALANLLRTPLAGGETVAVARPRIEGWIDELGWSVGVDRTGSFTFRVAEAA